MALGSVQVTAKNLGKVRVPLSQLPYSARTGGATFIVNSFAAELIDLRLGTWGLGSTDLAYKSLAASFCTPTAKYDTLLNPGGVDNAGALQNSLIGSTLTTVMNDNRTGTLQNTASIVNENAIGSGTLTLNQQPLLENVTLPITGAITNANNVPIFAMVQIGNSPPTFIPTLWFSAWGNNVINNTFIFEMFHGQAIGPPTQNWFGPTIPGGINQQSGQILPEAFSIETSRALSYGDISLHTISSAGHLPDVKGLSNRWIIPDNTPQWRIISFLPGERTPGDTVYNTDGTQSFVTFDDASINSTINSTGVVMQAWANGFLMKSSALFNGSVLLILLTPDGTGYYQIVPVGMDAVADDILSTGNTSSYAFGYDGTLYAKKANSAEMASSFGITPFTLSIPQLQPIQLPCFEPCLPYPEAYPSGGI